MKQILMTLCAFALSSGLVMGYHHGDGSGTGDGPYSGSGGLWAAIDDLPEGEVQDAYNAVLEARTFLRDSRAEAVEGLTDPEEIKEALALWRTQTEVVENFQIMQTNLAIVREWFHSTRPDRPDPEQNTEMLQRRFRFREITQNIRQLHEQLQGMDPNSDEAEAIKAQLRQQIAERKHLIRARRIAEGGSGGEGGRRPVTD